MIFKRFFTTIAAFLMCVAVTRAINGAGPVNSFEIVTYVQQIDFDLRGLFNVFEPFHDFWTEAYWPDYDALPRESFGDYVAGIWYVIVGYGKFMVDVVVKQFVALWDIIVTVKDIAVAIINLFVKVLGFKVVE